VALDNGDNFVYFLSEEVEVPAPTPTSSESGVSEGNPGEGGAAKPEEDAAKAEDTKHVAEEPNG